MNFTKLPLIRKMLQQDVQEEVVLEYRWILKICSSFAFGLARQEKKEVEKRTACPPRSAQIACRETLELIQWLSSKDRRESARSKTGCALALLPLRSLQLRLLPCTTTLHTHWRTTTPDRTSPWHSILFLCLSQNLEISEYIKYTISIFKE